MNLFSRLLRPKFVPIQPHLFWTLGTFPSSLDFFPFVSLLPFPCFATASSSFLIKFLRPLPFYSPSSIAFSLPPPSKLNRWPNLTYVNCAKEVRGAENVFTSCLMELRVGMKDEFMSAFHAIRQELFGSRSPAFSLWSQNRINSVRETLLIGHLSNEQN